jgi:hypothetical protein
MIRALEIPGLQQTSLAQPEASPSVAAAPAAALGSVAGAIAGVGQTFEGIAQRIQGAENARSESEARQTWLQGWGQLQTDLTRDPDPASHITRTREFLQQQRGTIDAPDLAPVVRDRLRLQYDDFATRALNQTTANASQLAVTRARAAMENEIDASLRGRNIAGVQRAVETNVANGVLLPEQGQKIITDAESTIVRNNYLDQAASDPAGFVEQYGTDSPEGLNPVEHQQILGTARASLARVTAETSAQILDGIVTGNITTPEQIDDLTPNLRPAARARLKFELAEQASAATKAVRASPGYQASTVAKVGEMLDAYTVDTEGFDEKFVEMDTMVRSLPPGAVKEELGRRLTSVRDGQVRQLETAADYHRQALEDLTKSGAFGTPTVRRPVTDFVRAGILKDVAKLEKTGIPVETAREIAQETDPRKQVASLKEALAEAGKEGGFLDTNEPFDRQVFDALVKGEGFVEMENLAAKEKSRRAAGLAKTKLEDWLRLHPQATEEQGREALKRILTTTAIPGAVESILATPPDLGDGMVLPPKPTE